jgi:phage gp36-like protein
VTYTTPDEVRAVLVHDGIARDRSTAACLDDATIQGACQQATDEIDAVLGGLYSVPFDNPITWPDGVPAMVSDIAAGVAAYLATLLFLKGMPLEPTNPVSLLYARVERHLAMLQSRQMVMQDNGSEPETVDATVVNPYKGRLFTEDNFGIGPALIPERGRRVMPPDWPF